jgi:hypothetical protein
MHLSFRIILLTLHARPERHKRFLWLALIIGLIYVIRVRNTRSQVLLHRQILIDIRSSLVDHHQRLLLATSPKSASSHAISEFRPHSIGSIDFIPMPLIE